MGYTIPEGFVLETDPEINRIFKACSWVPHVMPTDEALAAYEEYANRMKAKADKPVYVSYEPLDCDYVSSNALAAETDKCTWGTQRIARLVSRYILWYNKKPSADRTYILESLESVAKENHVVLPKLSELKTRVPKKRLISEAVDVNRYNRLYNLKVYYDGENIVGYVPGENKAKERELHARTKWDDLFDSLYLMLKSYPENNERNKTSEEKADIRRSIEVELVRQFYEVYCYDDKEEDEPCPLFISRKLWNMTSSYRERKKRFHRKKDQVRWTAWWTITYSNEKFASEEDFRRTLLTYFKNRSNRDKWRIMGVFEHGEERGRLHFHGFFYFPKGHASGELVYRKKWSEKEHAWHNYYADSELLEKFGDNEYEDISEALQKNVNAMVDYTAKMVNYMDMGEKIFYSRHIPSEFELEALGSEMLCFYSVINKRKITRCVLWDDSFTRSDLDISRKKPVVEQQLCDIGLLDECSSFL